MEHVTRKEKEPVSQQPPLHEGRSGLEGMHPLMDRRPFVTAQTDFQRMVQNSPHMNRFVQLKAIVDNRHSSAATSTSAAETSTLPAQLKTGIESLSGMAMDDVRVHFHSDKPAQLKAHAYTQGTDIHIAPGQEQHLAHEAWHVVQQKQGRVKPTLQLKGVAINDDSALEREADVMGGRISSMGAIGDRTNFSRSSLANGLRSISPIQRKIKIGSAAEGNVTELRREFKGNNAVQKLIAEWVKDDETRNFGDVKAAKMAVDDALQIRANALQIHAVNQNMINSMIDMHDQAQSQQGGYTYDTALLEQANRLNLLAKMLRDNWEWNTAWFQRVIDLDFAIGHTINQLLASFGQIVPQDFDEPPQAEYKMVEWGNDSIQHLLGSMARLHAPDRKTRFAEIGNLRGQDDEAPLQADEKQGAPHYRGAIPFSFINSARNAILNLVEQVGDSVAIFSLERGGSLLADHIMDLLEQVHHQPIHNIKVPKSAGRHTHPDVKEEKSASSSSSSHIQAASNSSMSSLVPAPRRVRFGGIGAEEKEELYTRERHHRSLALRMMNFEEGHMFRSMLRSEQIALIPPVITIALAETAVSGSSVNTLLSTLTRYHSALPRSRFRLLVEKQTIKEDLKGQPEGGLRVHDVGIHPENSLDVDSISQIQMFIAQAHYILGEDVGYQVSYDNDLKGQPLVVFDESTGQLIAVKLSQDDMLPRDMLRRLISGEFDRLLAELLQLA